MSAMNKGSVWFNGFHLGAYWLIRDQNGRFCQQHYHIPRDYLLPAQQNNTVIVLEEVGGDPYSIAMIQRNATKTDSTLGSATADPVTARYAYRGGTNIKVGDERRQIQKMHKMNHYLNSSPDQRLDSID